MSKRDNAGSESMPQVVIEQPPPPSARVGGATIEMVVCGPPVPRSRAWRLLGDTDWMNRKAGNGSILDQAMTLQTDGLPAVEGNIAGPVGLKLPFREVWTSWAVGRYFQQVRDIDSPLLRRSEYQARLNEVGELVEPEIVLRLTVPRMLKGVISLLQLSTIRRQWQRALDELAMEDEPVRSLSAAAEVALGRWSERSDPSLVAEFRALMQRASPTELQRLRGFSLADQWGRDRSEVVEAMLHGVEAGALELYWSTRCTRCKGPVASSSSLSELSAQGNCPSCRIGFETDLGENVEVLFAAQCGLVSQAEERFCTLYPAGSPELFGVFTLDAMQQLQQTITLPPGQWRLGSGGDAPDLIVSSQVDGGTDAVRWRSDHTGDIVHVEAGETTLHLDNDTDKRHRVYLIRTDAADRIPASYLTTHPLFRARMSHQVLAPDLRLSVRSVVLMFTDLSGSTLMYEDLGDAQAFAVVRDHFTLLRQSIEEQGGTVVKTIGDAVMASFYDVADAMRSALQMQSAFHAWAQSLGLEVPPHLKIGLHMGPALVVNSDAFGIDYFGGTVNLAARTEGVARGGEIVWTQMVHDDPRIAALLAEVESPVDELQRELKGLKQPIVLYRVRL